MQLLNNYIEDTILASLLKKGSQSTTQLLAVISAKHDCTRQGFYRALRKLRDEERVVVYRSTVTVNQMWLRQIKRLVGGSDQNVSIIGDFSALQQGDQLSLTLTGLQNMDRLWAHIFSIVEETVPVKEALFLYNPHNWSALLRAKSDRVHEESLRSSKRSAYLIIGSGSQLDKDVTRAVGFAHVQFSFNPRLTQQMYVAVIGEYVIEVKFSPKTRAALDTLFKNETTIAAATQRLERLEKSAASKILIEKNVVKAKQWAGRFEREFYIPKVARNK